MVTVSRMPFNAYVVNYARQYSIQSHQR